MSQEKSGDERSEAGSQPADEDYDVEEEYDNDYAENYFDPGEDDDNDNLGGGGGADEGGGASGSYSPSSVADRILSQWDMTSTSCPQRLRAVRYTNCTVYFGANNCSIFLSTCTNHQY